MKVDTGIHAKDLRAIVVLIAVVIAVYFFYWRPQTVGASAAPLSVSDDDVLLAEQRLARLREIAATVEGKTAIQEKVAADLVVAEKGLIQAETGAQAEAEITEILRRLGADEAPGVDVSVSQLGALRPLGEFYAAAPVTIQMNCQVEQLVNFLAALAVQPQVLTTENLQITSANPQTKVLRVQVTVSGVVSRSLLPAQKGSGA